MFNFRGHDLPKVPSRAPVPAPAPAPAPAHTVVHVHHYPPPMRTPAPTPPPKPVAPPPRPAPVMLHSAPVARPSFTPGPARPTVPHVTPVYSAPAPAPPAPKARWDDRDRDPVLRNPFADPPARPHVPTLKRAAFTPEVLAEAAKKARADGDEWQPFYKHPTGFHHQSLFTAYLAEMYPRYCKATMFTLQVSIENGKAKDYLYKKRAGDLGATHVAAFTKDSLGDPDFLKTSRIILIPIEVTYHFEGEKLYAPHHMVLVLYPTRRQAFLIDPMNDSATLRRVYGGMLDPSIEIEAQKVITHLNNWFIAKDPVLLERFPKGIVNTTMATLDIRKLLVEGRPESVSREYDCPLAFYLVIPILLYWPLIWDAPAFGPVMEDDPLLILQALLRHFVCRSYSTSYPPKSNYLDEFLVSAPFTKYHAEHFVKRTVESWYEKDCEKRAWKTFDGFIRIVVEGYMDSYAVRVKKARPGEMMAYNNNKWYTPGWEQSKDRDRAGDDVAEKRSQVTKIHRFLAFILADALKEDRPK